MSVRVHVCVCVTTINEKGRQGFEREQGVYGRIWREKREGGSDIIILQSQKEKNKCWQWNYQE